MTFSQTNNHSCPSRFRSQPAWTVLEDSSSSSRSNSPIPGLTYNAGRQSGTSTHRQATTSQKQIAKKQTTQSAANNKKPLNDQRPTDNVLPKPPTKSLATSAPKSTPITRHLTSVSTPSHSPKQSSSVARPSTTGRKRKAPISSDSESDHSPPRLPTLTELLANRKKKKAKGKGKEVPRNLPQSGRPMKIRKTTLLATVNIDDSNDERQMCQKSKKMSSASVTGVIDLCSDDDDSLTRPTVKPQSKSSHIREEDGVIVLSADDEHDSSPFPSVKCGTQKTRMDVSKPSSQLFSSNTPNKSTHSPIKNTLTTPRKSSLTLVMRNPTPSIHSSHLDHEFGDLLDFDDESSRSTVLAPFSSTMYQPDKSRVEERRRMEKRSVCDSDRTNIAPSPKKLRKTPLFLPDISSSDSPSPNSMPIFKPNGLLGTSKSSAVIDKLLPAPMTVQAPPPLTSTSSQPFRETIFGPKFPRKPPPEDIQMIDLDSDVEELPRPKHSSIFAYGPPIKLKLDIKYSDNPAIPPLLSPVWYARAISHLNRKRKNVTISPYFAKHDAREDVSAASVVKRNSSNSLSPTKISPVDLVSPNESCLKAADKGNIAPSSPKASPVDPSSSKLRNESSSKAADQQKDEYTRSLVEMARRDGQKLMEVVRMKSLKARGNVLQVASRASV
ncbi:hypothetical protein BDQ17DRAFT_1321236 [Cyathus striatus]|nr:hypothetical protein BDQ17DRAFT_1321236 [Cyathus striatus]